MNEVCGLGEGCHIAMHMSNMKKNLQSGKWCVIDCSFHSCWLHQNDDDLKPKEAHKYGNYGMLPTITAAS